LLEEEEKNRLEIIEILRDGPDLIRKNIIKEDKLRIACDNCRFYTDDEFFDIIIRISGSDD
jgi:hypothetical protein